MMHGQSLYLWSSGY
uniref:Uncharacterized protein n=1 Tax=Arundo donax TaxID=35708 RepID=A0A0A9FBN9_ARUDO